MVTKKTEEEILEMVSTTMRDFRESMEYSREMSVKIGRRTTQIIRMGMLSVLILGIVMAYLITTMAGDFGRITEQMMAVSKNMESMENHFESVNARMAEMQIHLARMNHSVGVLPQMNRSVGVLPAMQNTLGTMSTNLASMDKNVAGMHNAVGHMTGSMQRMDSQMNKMSRPMDYFPLP